MKKLEPTPEIKAFFDYGSKDENAIAIAVVEGDTIHFPRPVLRNGRLCCEYNGMWYILGAST